jgi:hypothetical protein
LPFTSRRVGARFRCNPRAGAAPQIETVMLS